MATETVQVFRNGVLISEVPVEVPVEVVNERAIRQRADDALAINTTIVDDADTYLAIPAPSQAQAIAQVRALTQAAKVAAQQRTALARLVLQRFDSTE